MCTFQNYDGADMSANSGEPTANNAFNRPGTLSSVELSLSYADNSFRDSQAMIVYRALSSYREQKTTYLAQFINSGEYAEAGAILEELQHIDQMQTDIALGFQDAAQQNKQAAEYQRNPAYYQSFSFRDLKAQDRYEANIESILN